MLGQTAAAEIEGASQQDAGPQVTYRVYRAYMSYSLNSLKGDYIGDYIGDYYTRSLDYSSYGLLGCSGWGLWGLGIRV